MSGFSEVSEQLFESVKNVIVAIDEVAGATNEGLTTANKTI